MAISVTLVTNAPTCAQDQPTIEWTQGPFTAKLANMATVEIPQGYAIADARNTRLFLEAFKLRPSRRELATFRPLDDQADWYVVLEFADDGFVKEEEQTDINPDAALQVLREINADENKQLVAEGWEPTTIVGWESPPRYNADTKSLHWAIRVQRAGQTDINVHSRVLGRFGVTVASLVVSPEDYPQVQPIYQSLIESFRYDDGHRYSEFRAGDKVARYGLTALITGTAATAALKLGLLRRLIAPAFAGLVALIAIVKRRMGFGRITVDSDSADNDD